MSYTHKQHSLLAALGHLNAGFARSFETELDQHGTTLAGTKLSAMLDLVGEALPDEQRDRFAALFPERNFRTAGELRVMSGLLDGWLNGTLRQWPTAGEPVRSGQYV